MSKSSNEQGRVCELKTCLKQKILALALLLLVSGATQAQDLEPRRWTHLPTGTNFFNFGGYYTEGEIFLDRVLQAEDVKFERAGVGLGYIRSFGLFGKTARFDVLLPYARGRWEGTVDGEFITRRRQGLGDPRLRFSMLLYGAPAQSPQEFSRSAKSNTVVGAAIALTLPTGDYQKDKLMNLGGNRWVLRPQIGVTHTRGKWTFETSGSIFFFSDNDDFWNDGKLENNELFAFQAHVIYSFRPGLWISLSTAYGWGWNPKINGEEVHDPRGNWMSALSFGVPLSRTQGIKLSWLQARTQEETGVDLHSLIVGWSIMF